MLRRVMRHTAHKHPEARQHAEAIDGTLSQEEAPTWGSSSGPAAGRVPLIDYLRDDLRQRCGAAKRQASDARRHERHFIRLSDSMNGRSRLFWTFEPCRASYLAQHRLGTRSRLTDSIPLYPVHERQQLLARKIAAYILHEQFSDDPVALRMSTADVRQHQDAFGGPERVFGR
jgi:hypothetical protein